MPYGIEPDKAVASCQAYPSPVTFRLQRNASCAAPRWCGRRPGTEFVPPSMLACASGTPADSTSLITPIPMNTLLLIVLCLFIGLGVGWLVRGSKQAPADSRLEDELRRQAEELKTELERCRTAQLQVEAARSAAEA